MHRRDRAKMSALITTSVIFGWYVAFGMDKGKQGMGLLMGGGGSCGYGSNVGVLLLNKYLLSVYGFKYPAFLTLCHMLACSVMSYGLAMSNTVTLQPVKSRQQFYKISTLALIFCVTVVLGNVSLKYIPVSFNQAIGATTPAFTALLAAIMLGHRESKEVYLSLIPVVVGIIIASGAEPMFDLVGFLAALMATAGRGLKSVLQGIMLSDSSEKMDSLSLLLYMAPVATVALVPITLYFEPNALAEALVLGKNPGFWPLLLFNSFLAYFVNLTNFLVTRHTSPLTLQVLGNAKGVVAVIISVICFRNPVTIYSILGYSVTVVGVVLYSQAKKLAKKNETLRKLTSKVSDIEQPRSPFGSSAESKNLSMDQYIATEKQNLLQKNENEEEGDVANSKKELSTAWSDRIMARGFSSIFEA